MNWTMIVLIVCCLVAAFALWKEYTRPAKRNLTLRILAVLLAVVALAGIILPIGYTKDITRDGHSGVLLTEGFASDSLHNYKDSRILTADPKLNKAYPQAKLIRLDELKNDTPAFSHLDVLGDGLDERELTELDSLPLKFHSPVAPSETLAVNWTQKINAGQPFRVQGKYNNAGSTPVKLVLEGLNSTLDTITIRPKRTEKFELHTVPKQTGRTVFKLLAISGNDTLQKETLPLEIVPVKPLKILILSASPDFETRFLKNWLSENGFSVAVRSVISKDKFSTEYVNMPAMNIDRLNSSLLEKFDVVIGDLSVLKSINGSEDAALKQQVTSKGLGVIIRADSSSKAISWLQRDFPVEKQEGKQQLPVALSISGKRAKTVLIKTDPVYIAERPGTQVLVEDGKRTLASSALVGSGRLVFTAINNSFSWMLNGDKDDYSAYWTLLISNASRKVPVTAEWGLSQFPIVDKPVDFHLQTPEQPGQVEADKVHISPAQNPSIPFEWSGTFRPFETGWQSVGAHGQTVWFYVYGNQEWKSVRAADKIFATARYAAKFTQNESVTKPIHDKVRIEFPKIYFYLLFLITCLYLWVERKLVV